MVASLQCDVANRLISEEDSSVVVSQVRRYGPHAEASLLQLLPIKVLAWIIGPTVAQEPRLGRRSGGDVAVTDDTMAVNGTVGVTQALYQTDQCIVLRS